MILAYDVLFYGGELKLCVFFYGDEYKAKR